MINTTVQQWSFMQVGAPSVNSVGESLNKIGND